MSAAVTESELAEYVLRRLVVILYFAKHAKLPRPWWASAETKTRDE